eukprot:657835-Rhodomonas_salina.1
MPAQATITLAATPSFTAKASNALMFVRLATAQVGINWWSQVPEDGGGSSNSDHDESDDDGENDSDDDDNGDRPVGRTEN